MKKLFTLVAIALLGGAVSVNAQTTDWNFSNWEQTTLTSLIPKMDSQSMQILMQTSLLMVIKKV